MRLCGSISNLEIMDSHNISTPASSSESINSRLLDPNARFVQNVIEPGDNTSTEVVTTRQQPIESTTSSVDQNLPVTSRLDNVGKSQRDNLARVLEAFQSQLDIQQEQLKLLQALLGVREAKVSQDDTSKQATVSKEKEAYKEEESIEQREANKQKEELEENLIPQPEASDWVELHDHSSRWQRQRFTQWVDHQTEWFLDECREKKMFWFSDPKVDPEGVSSLYRTQPPFGTMTEKGIELSLPVNAERMLSIHWYKYDLQGHMEWCRSVCPPLPLLLDWTFT
jgi:hypothetical protein